MIIFFPCQHILTSVSAVSIGNRYRYQVPTHGRYRVLSVFYYRSHTIVRLVYSFGIADIF